MASRRDRRAEQKRRRRARKSAGKRPARRARPARTLDFDPLEKLGYDPERAPDAAEWLALDAEERLSRVEAYHREVLPPGQQPPNKKLHAILHAVLETQLAEGDPAEARAALDWLMGEGLTRHDALHAMGFVLSKHLKEAMDVLDPVDAAAYARDLAALDRKSWLRAMGL